MSLFLLLLLSVPLHAALQPRCQIDQVPVEFQGCYRSILKAPPTAFQQYEARYCVYTRAKESSEWGMGARFLSQCLDEDDFWATLVKGHIDRIRPDQGRLAEGLYKKALRQAEEQAAPLGQVMVHVNLRDYYYHRERFGEAETHIQMAQSVADSHPEDKVAVAWAKSSLMEHYLDLDLIGEADSVLERYEPDFQLVESERLKRSVLSVRREAHVKKGELFQAASIADQLLRTADEESADWLDAKYHQLRIAKLRLERDLPKGYKEQLQALVQEGQDLLVAAQRRRFRNTEAIRVWLGYQKGRMPPPLRAQGQALLREVIARSKGKRDQTQAYYAHWGLVESYFREDRPQEALKVEQGVREIDVQDKQRVHGLWVSHMLLSLHQGDWDRAEALLDEIDRTRDLARGPSPKMRWLAGLTEAYWWLAGHALEAAAQEQDADLRRRAFRISERMRARVLLEELENANALQAIQPGLKALTEELSQLRDDLRRASHSAQEMAALEKRRGEVVARIQELRYQAISDEGSVEAQGPRFVKLDQVQAQLRPDQAMLSFQLGFDNDIFGHSAGGAWVLVIHRDSVQAFPTADHYWLREKLSLLEGLLKDRRALPQAVTAAFYRGYLQEAVDSLPDGVEELVIIPDALLNRLPFGLLSPDQDTPPLAKRFRLSMTPSATIWSRWRQAPQKRPQATTLVLADPDLGELEPETLGDVESLPLPYARREARDVTRFMGRSSRAYLGSEASESLVQSSAIEDFQVIHFAAHAISNHKNPERSAVLLSADGSQNGRLEVREIVFLNLEDRVIVLSACQSASGQVMLGEGVLGLARAFFQARARVVVGSLWPFRDDDAAFLFREFYRYLGQGQSVSGALQMAQVRAIEEGLPPQAWSGILAIGDGGFVPFPEGIEPAFHISGTFLSYAGVSLALVLLAGAVLMRRRSQ